MTRHCRSCDFVFFQRRLTDAEARRLYTNYRGDEYNKMRVGFEPHYTPLIDIFSDPLSAYYVERSRDYVDLLDVFPELGQIGKVLDFGGDGSVPARVFPNAQVAIDDLNAGSSDSVSNQYDLVFASNVFEHVSDPVSMLRQLRKKLAPEGVLLIDVPKPAQASLTEGLLWQERHGGELFEMHEHINHFSKRSLGLLIAAAGLEVFFEVSARYGVLIALAALPGSDIAERLKPEKAARTLLLETRLARAEARLSQDVARAAADRLRSELDEKLQTLHRQVADSQQLLMSYREPLAQKQSNKNLLHRTKRVFLSDEKVKLFSINGLRKLVLGAHKAEQLTT